MPCGNWADMMIAARSYEKALAQDPENEMNETN
jgi:hypothetical protein